MNSCTRWVGIVIAGWSVGCGGTTFTEGQSDGDASASDSSASDANARDGDISDGGASDSSPPLVHGCPTAAPTAGAACTDESLECEYGNAWWSVACDVVMQCTNGQWQSAHPSYEPCSPEPGPNPSGCPSTSGSIAQGSVCAPNDESCYYPDAFCQCIVPLGGPAQIDGGTAFWSCLPGMGCPYPRPPLGSACTQPSSDDCTYEACSYGQSCVNGAWQGSAEACASAQ
jgi:hypothetical protein